MSKDRVESPSAANDRDPGYVEVGVDGRPLGTVDEMSAADKREAEVASQPGSEGRVTDETVEEARDTADARAVSKSSPSGEDVSVPNGDEGEPEFDEDTDEAF
jgi:hypothetical protein